MTRFNTACCLTWLFKWPYAKGSGTLLVTTQCGKLISGHDYSAQKKMLGIECSFQMLTIWFFRRYFDLESVQDPYPNEFHIKFLCSIQLSSVHLDKWHLPLPNCITPQTVKHLYFSHLSQSEVRSPSVSLPHSQSSCLPCTDPQHRPAPSHSASCQVTGADKAHGRPCSVRDPPAQASRQHLNTDSTGSIKHTQPPRSISQHQGFSTSTTTHRDSTLLQDWLEGTLSFYSTPKWGRTSKKSSISEEHKHTQKVQCIWRRFSILFTPQWGRTRTVSCIKKCLVS